MTALSMLNHQLINNYHDGKITAIIQTDLSAAFDTVDYNILISKLEHYGLRGKISNILRSFLEDRYQYVSIDSIQSEVTQALPCSVIQGSKLSALLYTLYINEVTILHKLVHSEIYSKITGSVSNNIINNIDHSIIQYVDDSNNVISSDNIQSIQPYMNTYFKLIEAYYNINKLKINPDKSKLMIVCKAVHRKATKNIVLMTNDHIIEQVQKIKALGMYFTTGLSNTANINNIISKVNYRLSILKDIFAFSEKRTKVILMNSLVISIFPYCCPLLINSNINMISKLQTLLMKCTRYILGFKSSKMSRCTQTS